MTRPGQTQFDIRFPQELFVRMDLLAKRNWCEFTGEVNIGDIDDINPTIRERIMPND